MHMAAGQHLLLSLLVWVAPLTSGSAQEPIGAPAACSAGQTDLVLCYIDSSGYLADVQYSNTMRNTPVSTCGTQQWQLESVQLQTIELSGSDSILRFRACGDSGGLRGLVFRTALGAELSCGSPQDSSSSCRSFSSHSTYPLRGFSATCENINPGQHKHRSQGLVTRVSSIKAACWTPARQSAAQGPCPAGYGVQGGGLPCQVCPVSTYSRGGSAPCKPCATGTTTLTTGQRQCGCFPGYGVYGPVFQDPDVCEQCTAGTYAVGGALAPCQPCSTRAFDFLTSAPGSTSIADCTCAAGYGVTAAGPSTCSICGIGYYNAGPMPRAEQAAAAAAAAVARSNMTLAWAPPAFTRGAPPPAPALVDTGANHWAGAPLRYLPAPLEHSDASAAAAVLSVSAAAGAEMGNSQAVQQQHFEAGYRAHSAVNLLQQQQQQHWAVWQQQQRQPARQRSLQQVVDPIFYTPTYSPCTFCGPGCSTDGPGATSPEQCTCFVIPPVSPPTSPSPSPGISPTPSPVPNPSPSPSPSPSPTPSPSPSPSPSPTPSVGPCVVCDVNTIQQTMLNLCKDPAQTFPIIDSGSAPCFVRREAGGLNPTAWWTVPTNIFTDALGLVNCQLVRTVPGYSTLNFAGPAPANGACDMPSSYNFVIPTVTSQRLVGHRPRSNGVLPQRAARPG